MPATKVQAEIRHPGQVVAEAVDGTCGREGHVEASRPLHGGIEAAADALGSTVTPK